MQQSALRRDVILRHLSRGGSSFLLGVSIALTLLSISLQVFLLWGYSPRTSMGMLCGLPIGLALLSLLSSRAQIPTWSVSISLAAISLLAWPLLAGIDFVVSQLASQFALIPWLQILPAFVATSLLGIGFMLLLWGSSRLPSGWVPGNVSPWQWGAIACGAAMAFVSVGSVVEVAGLLGAQYLAALLAVVISLPAFVRSKDAIAARPLSVSDHGLIFAPVALSLVAFASGCLWTAWHRIAMQLILETANFLAAEFAGFSLGLAAGLTLCRLPALRKLKQTRILCGTFLACSLLISLALVRFDSLIAYSLWINTTLSSTFTALLCRSPLAAFGTFVLGLNVSFLLLGVSFHSTAKTPLNLALFTGLELFAVTLTQAFFPLTGPAFWVMAAIFCFTLAGFSLVPFKDWFSIRRENLLVIPGVAALVLAVFGLQAYQPAKAAQILFSTNMTQAKISGHGLNVMQYLDDTRFQRQFEGEQGTITLWTRRGCQVQIRANGVPKGVTTHDTSRHPHYSAEILSATLPMALHEQAHDVLLLGLGSGSPLGALLSSPVQHLDCVEQDRTLIEVVKHATVDPHWIDWQDDRLVVRNTSPLWWSRAHTNRYDLILSNPEQSALLPLASNYTREFYQSAARALRPSGIFCQRFISIDFGATPWDQIAQTMGDAFKHVMAVDTAHGEVLLLASNDPRGLVREGLVKRLKAGQVSETLAVLGWDWSLPLTLATYDPQSQALIPPATAVNTAWQGSFLFGWSRELSRWGLKTQELATKLQGHSRKLGELFPEECNSRDVLRRLAEVQVQQDSVIKYPDQYWSYRKALKEEVQKNPRTLIKQIAFESSLGEFDPEDQRRMDYIDALNTASQTRTLEDIKKLEKFARPFDPMISPFVPQELAELYSRAGHPDPGAELTHRLHTIYYSGTGDRSVLYVVDALQLILDHPEALADDAARWKQLDSLLQVLHVRWYVRGVGKNGTPRVMYRDAEKSLTVGVKALDWMKEHASTAGVPATGAAQRCWVLEYQMIRPLRDYKQQLLPYLTPSDMIGSDRPNSVPPAVLQGN